MSLSITTMKQNTQENFGYVQGNTSCVVKEICLDEDLRECFSREVANVGVLVSKRVVMIFATLLTLFIQNITCVKWGPWAMG